MRTHNLELTGLQVENTSNLTFKAASMTLQSGLPKSQIKSRQIGNVSKASLGAWTHGRKDKQKEKE